MRRGPRHTLRVVKSVLTGLVLGLLVWRAFVSIGDLDQAGLQAFDVVGLGIVVTLGAIALMFWLIKLKVRAAANAVRRQHPTDVVLPIAIRAEDIAQLSALGALQQPTKPNHGAIVIGRTSCTWWMGVGAPRKIAALASELPIEYSVGSYLHAGLAQTGLVGDFVVSGRRTALPLVLIREKGMLPNKPRDEELEDLVGLLAEVRLTS